MTAKTSWTAGNGAGLAWATAINSADLASLPNGSTVLSTVADIENGTNLDMFMDISVRISISASALAAGANFALWLYDLLDDAATYGDGQLVPGVQAALTPAFAPCATISLPVAAVADLVGYANEIVIPPGSFRLALQNNSGFTLAAGSQVVKMRTYNINLNN